jgi:hypothetical protein
MDVLDTPDNRDEKEERCDDRTSNKGGALLTCKSVRALNRSTDQHFENKE